MSEKTRYELLLLGATQLSAGVEEWLAALKRANDLPPVEALRLYYDAAKRARQCARTFLDAADVIELEMASVLSKLETRDVDYVEKENSGKYN